MAQATAAQQFLRFVDADQLRGWSTSLEGVAVMSVKDQMLGGLDGLLVGAEDRPHYLVVVTRDEPKRRFLLPVGVAWFDETTGVIRTDLDTEALAACPAFDVKGYKEMSPDQAWEYERRVLRICCPETLDQSAGRLDYYRRLPQFRPGEWIKRKASRS